MAHSWARRVGPTQAVSCSRGGGLAELVDEVGERVTAGVLDQAFSSNRRWGRLRSAFMGEVWKAVVGLLISGIPLLAVQVGGRRGLLRRAIREDLELIKLLHDEHSAVRDRLQRRVTARLEQYEPADHAKARRRRGRILTTVEGVVLVTLAVVILTVFDVSSGLASGWIGAGLGVVGAVTHLFVTSKLDRREQDRAVATLEAALPGLTSDITGKVTPPAYVEDAQPR